MNTTAKTISRTKTKRRVLDAVYETGADLHRLGFIDEHKMAQYKAMCIDSPESPTTPKFDARRTRG